MNHRAHRVHRGYGPDSWLHRLCVLCGLCGCVNVGSREDGPGAKVFTGRVRGGRESGAVHHSEPRVTGSSLDVGRAESETANSKPTPSRPLARSFCYSERSEESSATRRDRQSPIRNRWAYAGGRGDVARASAGHCIGDSLLGRHLDTLTARNWGSVPRRSRP